MNSTKHSLGRIAGRFAITFVALCVLAGTPPSHSQTPAVENTSFAEVTAHLDPGGSLYGYLSVEQWLPNLSSFVGDFREGILSIEDIPEDEKAGIRRGFDVAIDAVRKTGVENITGIGLSGIAIEDGLFRTRVFVHRRSGSPASGMWNTFGSAPQPLTELHQLPADTVWAQFSDCDVPSVWNAINQIITENEIQPAIDGLGEFRNGFKQVTGKTFDETISTLDGQIGGVLTFSQTTTLTLTSPSGAEIQVPEPGILLAFKVSDPTIYNIADAILSHNPESVTTELGGNPARVLPIQTGLPLDIRLTFVQYEGRLLIASNEAVASSFIASMEGSAPTIATSPEFVRLARGLPVSGNAFAFISSRFNTALQETIQKFVIPPDAADAGAGRLMEIFSGQNSDLSAMSVGQSLPDGWLSISHGTQRPESAILLPLVVAPTAVFASMVLPALSKAKAKAQSIKCMNNLKQVALAAHLHATDHDDRFPDSLADLKDELPIPAVLYCPAVQPNDASTYDWDAFDFDHATYEYLGAGIKTNDDGIIDKVIARCPIHGTTAYGDGRVISVD